MPDDFAASRDSQEEQSARRTGGHEIIGGIDRTTKEAGESDFRILGVEVQLGRRCWRQPSIRPQPTKAQGDLKLRLVWLGDYTARRQHVQGAKVRSEIHLILGVVVRSERLHVKTYDLMRLQHHSKG